MNLEELFPRLTLYGLAGDKLKGSYRAFIFYEVAIHRLDDTQDDYNKRGSDVLITACTMFYGNDWADNASPEQIRYAVKLFMDEHSIKKYTEAGEASEDVPTESPKHERAYDFLIDAQRIYAAFRRAYGIDLTTEDLNWEQFMALLVNLPQNDDFSKIMQYRLMDLESIEDKKERARYARLKKQYQIKDTTRKKKMTAEEANEAFKQRLRAANKRAHAQSQNN